LIKGFIETSFLDWDGHIVSTLYVPGCNFRCPFCHNSGLIEHPEQYETVPLEKIENYLLEHKDFLDGICLTGGEPALHKNAGLYDFLKRVKSHGFKIKFDTNGTDPEVLKNLYRDKLVDYVAMDLKAPFDERYNKLAGVKVDLNKIKESVKTIMESNVPYELRTTVVPTLLDTKDIEDLAGDIRGAEKFVLQQFVADNCWDKEMRSVKPYSKEKLEQMAKAAEKHVKKVEIRGA